MSQSAHSLTADDTSAPASASATAPPEGWLSAADAAAALGLSVRAVQLRCQRGQLTGTLVRGAWWVDPGCAPALRIATGNYGPCPATAGSALAGLTESQRRRMSDRHEMVNGYLAALDHRPRAMSSLRLTVAWVEAWNAQGDSRPRTSRSALLRWVAAYRKSGVAGLVDRRGGYRRAVPFSAEAKEFILGLYLRENHTALPYIVTVARGAAHEEGWQIPALRTVQQWIRTKIDPKLLAAGQDPRKFRDRCQPYVKRDWSLVAPMECWVIDHRIFDVVLPRPITKTVNGREVQRITWQRPWITMILDCRSWMPVAWIIDFDSPNAHRIASAFVMAVEAHGIPENVVLDNGKDFRAHEFAGSRSRRRREKLFDERRTAPLLEALGVRVHWAIPYNARAKIVERWFALCAAQFDRAWPTYLGSKPEKRPEVMKSLKVEDVDPQKLDIAVFREVFARWVLDDYALAQSPSSACRGLSPMRAFQELRRAGYQPVRPASDTLAMMITRGRRVKIDRNGLFVRALQGFYWSDDPEFERRRAASGNDMGRHVAYRYAEGDPSKVWVFDFRTDRFLFVATPYIANNVDPLHGCNRDGEVVLDKALALQRRLARDANRSVREARKTADNVLLAAHRRGSRASGISDNPDTIKKAPPPVVRLVGTGELDRAAMAGIEHERKQRDRRSRPSAAEFLATGTVDDDPAEAVRQRHVGPLESLAATGEVQHDNDDPGEP